MPEVENLSGSARLRTKPNPNSNDHDNPNPFQQSDDIFSVPEEPVTEDTVEAYHDDVESEETIRRRQDGTEDDGVGKTQVWRPWYRRPSAWWYVPQLDSI